MGVEGTRGYVWRVLHVPGHEHAELARNDAGCRLTGVSVMLHDGRPCRLDYDIRCDEAWTTRSATVRAHLGDEPVSLELMRTPGKGWHVNGTKVPVLDACVDVDLGFSPSTNLLPIRRLRLAIGERAELDAAWVRFPELTVEVLPQAYTRTGATSYLYESRGGSFQREITVDDVGFVVDYPDFWRAEDATTVNGER